MSEREDRHYLLLFMQLYVFIYTLPFEEEKDSKLKKKREKGKVIPGCLRCVLRRWIPIGNNSAGREEAVARSRKKKTLSQVKAFRFGGRAAPSRKTITKKKVEDR